MKRNGGFAKLNTYLFYVFIALRRRFGSGRSDLWHGWNWTQLALHKQDFFRVVHLLGAHPNQNVSLYNPKITFKLEPESPAELSLFSLTSKLKINGYRYALFSLIILVHYKGCAGKGFTLHVSGFSKLSAKQISLFCSLTNHQHAVIRSNPPPSYALFEHLWLLQDTQRPSFFVTECWTSDCLGKETGHQGLSCCMGCLGKI